MIRQLWALTGATLRDGLRSQVFINLAVFAGFAVVGALVLEQVALGIRGRVLLDIGVAGTSLVNALLACFMVVRTMGGEEDRQTLLAILARPVRRATVLAGKYLGVAVLIGINTAGAMALLWIAGSLAAPVATADLALAWLGLWAEGALVTAVVLAFTTFTGSTVAVVLGLGVYVCGLFAGELRTFADRNAGTPLEGLVRGFYNAVPNLQRLDFHAAAPSLGDLAATLLYSGFYVVAALALGALVLERRDLR